MKRVLDDRAGLSIASLSGFKNEIEKLNGYSTHLGLQIEQTSAQIEQVNEKGSNDSLEDIINSKLMSEQDFINGEQNIQASKIKKQDKKNKKQSNVIKIAKLNIAIVNTQSQIDSINEEINLKESNAIKYQKQKQERFDDFLKSKPELGSSDPQTQSQLNVDIEFINKAENEERAQNIQGTTGRISQLQAKIHSYQEQIENGQKDCNDYTKCHHIFVIDESDSMKEDWASLQKIFEQQALNANVIGSQHIFSLIMFSTKAEIIKKKVKAGELGGLRPLLGGGTNFLPAFQKIKDVVTLNPDRYTPIVQFLTDGKDDRVDPKVLINLAKEMKKLAPSLKFFAIGFGKEYNKDFLSSLCLEVNGGQYLKIKGCKIEYCSNAQDVSALEQIFQELATMYENTYEVKQIQHLMKLLKDQESEQLESESRIQKFYEVLRLNAVERAKWMENMRKEEQKSSQSLQDEWRNRFQVELEDQEQIMSHQLEATRNNLARKLEIIEENKHQVTEMTEENQELDQQISKINIQLQTFQKDQQNNLLLNYEKIGMTTPHQMEILLGKYSSISQEKTLLMNILGKLQIYYEALKNNLEGIINGFSFTNSDNINSCINTNQLQITIKEYYSKNYFNELQNTFDLKESIKNLLQAKNKSKFIQLEPYYDMLYSELIENLAQISLSTKEQRKKIIDELVQKILPIDDDKSSNDKFTEKLLGFLGDNASDKSLLLSDIQNECETPNAPQLTFNQELLSYTDKKDFENLKTKTQVTNQIKRTETKIVTIVQKIKTQRDEVDLKLAVEKLQKLTQLYDFCNEINETNIVTGRIETMVGLIKEIVDGPIVSLFKSQQFKTLEQQLETFSQISKPRIQIMSEITFVLSIERPDALKHQQSKYQNSCMIKEEMATGKRLELRED